MSEKIKILDPFLPEWLHIRIKNEVMTTRFPWHFPAYAIDNEPDPYKSCFGIVLFDRIAEIDAWDRAPSLTHAFDSFAWESKNWFDIETIMRCRGNMYAPGQDTSPHIDNENEDRWSLLYYLSDSDGGTIVDGQMIQHKENTAVLFDARLNHQAVATTSPCRVTINWIIAGKYKTNTVKL
jgi:hypothetical protein